MDRRSLKRRHLIYYLRVFRVADNQLLGHMVDISQKGLMLVSENPLSENSLYQMKIILPFLINEKKELFISGRCIYCKPDVNSSFYNSGFEISEITDPEIAVVINRLIQQYGFKD